jgi:hypothetical protein
MILREKYGMRVLEKRVRRRISGPTRNEGIEGWKELHNEDLHNLYSPPSKIRMMKSRRMRWGGHVERLGSRRNVYGISVGKPEEKRPLG